MSDAVPIVMLKWGDANSEYGWKHPDDCDGELVEIVTIGFLVKETSKTLVVSTSASAYGRFSDPLTVPKSLVTERYTIDMEE